MFWMRNEVFFQYALLSGGLLIDGQDIKINAFRCFFQWKMFVSEVYGALKYRVFYDILFYVLSCYVM